jgi:lipoprotein NlpD
VIARERAQPCAPCVACPPAVDGGWRRGRQALAVALLALTGSLGGCASLQYEADGAAKGDARTYVVRKGDTLYKIAWQQRVDQRDLARWNGIKDPDVIHVGQVLKLGPSAAPPRAGALGGAARASSSAPRSGASRSAARSRSAPGARSAPAPTPPTPVLPPPAWAWPTDGSVATRFGGSEGIASGIGIRGREGQPIRAAAAGRVVYAGSGLMSYGQLLIIKHNDTYLSAYGFNSRLLVAQGEDVAKGQTIAAMGLSPQREPRLHFEIRRNGVPVDPLLLVPEK